MSASGHSRPSHFVPVLNNVRYASDSDHSRYEFELTLWAIKRPTAPQQKSVLFNHLVGEHEEVVWHFDPERSSGFEIDDELEFGRLLHRDVAGLGPA